MAWCPWGRHLEETNSMISTSATTTDKTTELHKYSENVGIEGSYVYLDVKSDQALTRI